jgi:putative SOS response-associated peptidase YedK
MTAHFESVLNAALYPDAFDVAAPNQAFERDVWPRKAGVFIRHAAVESTPMSELGYGQFGLVPPWVKSASDAKLRSTKLINARSETVTTSNNFRDSWLNGQRCIVPVMAFFEDDWRSGKAVPTRISRVDGKPMGVAGLWERWEKEGVEIVSFTLLTVNANSHALLHRYQQNGNEKRMPAILGEGAYAAWLSARPEKAREFMRAYPAHLLTANPVEKKSIN